MTVVRYMNAMHKVGAVHIAEWRPDIKGRCTVKAYALGIGKDKRRPDKKTHKQRSADYRERQRQKQMQLVVAGQAKFEQSANGRLKFVLLKENQDERAQADCAEV